MSVPKLKTSSDKAGHKQEGEISKLEESRIRNLLPMKQEEILTCPVGYRGASFALNILQPCNISICQTTTQKYTHQTPMI